MPLATQEQKILEETVAPLTPHSPVPPASLSPMRGDVLPATTAPQGTIVRSLADWERKQEILERQTVREYDAKRVFGA